MRRFGQQHWLRCCATVLLVCLGPVLPVHADAKIEAKELYASGEADYNLGDFEAALSNFEKAYKLARVPAILFNIAQCHRQLKRFERAASAYRSFIRMDPNNASVGKAQGLLAQVEAALEANQSTAKAPPLEQQPVKLGAARDDGNSPLTATTPQSEAQPVPAPPLMVVKQEKPAPPQASARQGLSQPALPAAPAIATSATSATSAPEATGSGSLVWWIVGGSALAAGVVAAVLVAGSSKTVNEPTSVFNGR